MADIHSTAIIHPSSEVHESAVIGPHCVVGPRCSIGAGTRLEAFVHVKQDTTLGENNAVHSHVVLGDDPQHLAYKGHQARLVFGDGNTLREGFTAHRPVEPEGETRVGNDCFFMAQSHVGHDATVGDNVIMANATALGGHAVVERQANLSAFIGVHQFARVGRLAMIGGLTRVTGDVPPFCMAVEGRLRGLNSIGMKRAGIHQKARSQVKTAFKAVFCEGRALTAGLEVAKQQLAELGDGACEEAWHFIEFIERRGKRHILRYSDDDS